MSGHVVHFEIPADDTKRASEFYRSAFGWDISPIPEMDYMAVGTTPADEQGMPLEPGSINGGMFRRSASITGPVITIDVDDIDAALEKIGELGGATVEARRAVGDLGFTAYFRDTEDNLLGLWETAAAPGDGRP